MSSSFAKFAAFIFLCGTASSALAAASSAKEAVPAEPFAFADFTWLTGNPRTKESPLDTTAFTGEFRVDVNYTHDFNHPQDDTIVGSSEIFRSREVQLTQLGIGGDFHYMNVRGRLMTQFGMYSQATPRNDASTARGQWNLDSAYRYISEAYGGYHFDALNGINFDAGIFLSYVGLFSYYQFDNWAYQPSYVSSNTPWFFNGVRIQLFISDKLKIEPWIVNGWQSYGKFNQAPGLGVQIQWRPTGYLSILGNQYWGTDTLGNSDRMRIHTDDSIQVKYLDHPESFLSKAAFTFTFDVIQSQPGFHVIKAEDPSSGARASAAFTVLAQPSQTLSLTIKTGSVYFPGDTLVAYLSVSLNGVPAAPTGLQVSALLTFSNGTCRPMTLTILGTGLYEATYAIPRSGPLGTYAIVARAHLAGPVDASSMTSFQVQPSWLSSNKNTIMTVGTLAGVIGLVGVAWKKGYLRRKDEPAQFFD